MRAQLHKLAMLPTGKESLVSIGQEVWRALGLAKMEW